MQDQHISDFFEKCKQLIYMRGIDYSPPEINIGRISKSWSEYLQMPVSKYDVCILMTMLKMARLCNGHHQDSLNDAACYLALASKLAEDGVDYD